LQPCSVNVSLRSRDGEQIRTVEVIGHLADMLDSARRAGEEYLIVRSSELHKELGLVSRMPTVCDAMYKLKELDDRILEAPPKGRGSRLIIEYKLRCKD